MLLINLLKNFRMRKKLSLLSNNRKEIIKYPSQASFLLSTFLSLNLLLHSALLLSKIKSPKVPSNTSRILSPASWCLQKVSRVFRRRVSKKSSNTCWTWKSIERTAGNIDRRRLRVLILATPCHLWCGCYQIQERPFSQS